MTPFSVEEIIMLHQLLLASYSQPEAAGFILRGIKGIFLLVGGFIAAIICGVIAAFKGRNPFDGIVTCPLHKEGLHAAGVSHPGHTEILAERTGADGHHDVVEGAAGCVLEPLEVLQRR